MDKEQAIEVLKPLVNSYVDYANITMKEEDDDIAEALEMAVESLKDQPTIQPERAEGEWIVHLYKLGVNRYECDTCHARCDIIYPYCPYCGEKKEGERYAIN